MELNELKEKWMKRGGVDEDEVECVNYKQSGIEQTWFQNITWIVS